MAAVLKTAMGATSSWVRIPRPPLPDLPKAAVPQGFWCPCRDRIATPWPPAVPGFCRRSPAARGQSVDAIMIPPAGRARQPREAARPRPGPRCTSHRRAAGPRPSARPTPRSTSGAPRRGGSQLSPDLSADRVTRGSGPRAASGGHATADGAAFGPGRVPVVDHSKRRSHCGVGTRSRRRTGSSTCHGSRSRRRCGSTHACYLRPNPFHTCGAHARGRASRSWST